MRRHLPVLFRFKEVLNPNSAHLGYFGGNLDSKVYLMGNLLKIYLLLCVLCKIQSYNKILTEVDLEHHSAMMDVIKFMFNNESCIQLFNDMTHFSWSILTDLYKIDMVGSIFNNPVKEISDCKNVLVAMQNLSQTNPTFTNVPLLYGYNVLLLFERCTIDTDWLLNTNVGQLIFQDAEGLLYIANSKSIYSRIQPKDSLEEVKALTGKWKDMDFEIKDFLGKALQIATFNCSVFTYLGPLNKDSTPEWVKGVEGSIMYEITQRLNLTWKTLIPEENNKWGRLVNSTWDGGILRMIQEKKADVAFCGVWVDLNLVETGVELSMGIGQECMKFVVPRPRPATTGWQNIFKPFQFEVWMCILIFLVISVGLLLFFSWLTSQWYIQHREIQQLDNCIFEIVTIFLTSASQKDTIGALRQLVFACILLSFLFVTCFSSGLYSQLTMPKYSEKMDTIEQMVRNDYYWTTSVPPDSSMILNLENPWELAWSKNYVFLDSWENASLHYKKNPKMVLWGHQLGKGFIYDEDYDINFLRTFEASSICHRPIGFTFGHRRGSPYVKSFDTIISRFQSGGLIEKLANDVFDRLAPKMPHVYEWLEFEKAHMAKKKSLALENIIGVLHVFICGMTISLLVFICEIIINKCHR